MYDLIQGLGTVAYLVFFTLYGKHFNISRIKSFILGVCSMIIYLMLVKFLAWAETGFKYFGSENAIRVYVCIPVFIYGIAKVSRVKTLALFDMQAAAGVLMYGIGHLACISAGCCHGFAYHEGTTMYKIAHALTGTNMLPMQLLESLTAFFVFALVCWIGWKMKYQTNGRMFCAWFVVFGFSRFLWEFLRDNKKIIVFAPLEQADGYLGISSLAIWALLMACAGFLMYYIIRNVEKEQQKTAYKDEY